MITSILSAVLAVIVAYSIRCRLKALRMFREHNIPGPPPSFLWGNLWEIYRNGQLEMQREWHKQYGPVIGYFVGVLPVIVVSDTELLRRIQTKDFQKFTDRPDIVSRSFAGGFEQHLFALKGQRWKEVRATLTPSFTSKKLREITSIMCAAADDFMENADESFNNSSDFELSEAYKALTLDTICKAAMGVDYKVQKNFRTSEVLQRANVIVTHHVDIFFILVASFPILLFLFGKLFTTLNLRLRNSGEHPIGAFQRETGEVVKLRRSSPEKMRRSDLLQLMMDAQNTGISAGNLMSLTAGDAAEEIGVNGNETKGNTVRFEAKPVSTNKPRGLSDSEVIDNAVIVLLAGFETTSSTLAFLAKMLLRFPEVQERVRTELLEATDSGKVFDFERLQSCQYTEAVIQETLRMYSPVYFFTARVTAEDTKHGKMTIPKGIAVLASTNELHYNEEAFPNPREFRPERFLPENRTPAMTAAFQPFGAGPRNCIGIRFAQMEIKVSMAKLLTKYRISSENEPRHDPLIPTTVLLIVQQIRDPLRCKLELL